MAGCFKLFGDLLAFVGPWSIESIVDYAYKALDASSKNATSPIESSAAAGSYLATNSSNLTMTLVEAEVSVKVHMV